MKPVFDLVIGNESLKKRLADDILKNRLSHAYILEGAYGSGKHTLAMSLAAAIACRQKDEPNAPLPCCTCPSCKKILGGNSPDVIFIRREEGKATVGVDLIRELRQDVSIAPNELPVKLYIVEDAHLMTEQAQNAFLLTLEEPPEYVVFLLLCETSAALLETVRSRAPTLRTEPIPTNTIASHLRHISTEAASLAGSAPEEFSEITAAANGSIGRALELMDPKRRKPIVAKREAARELIRLCSARKSTAATARYLNSLPQKREELVDQLGFTLLCLRDLLLCKQTERAPLCFFADREEACTLAYGFTTPQLLKLCDAVNEAIDRLKKSANVRLTMTSFAVQCGLI